MLLLVLLLELLLLELLLLVLLLVLQLLLLVLLLVLLLLRGLRELRGVLVLGELGVLLRRRVVALLRPLVERGVGVALLVELPGNLRF